MGRKRAVVALLLVATLGIGGCGKSTSKPKAVAGCDADSSGVDVGIRFIAKELRFLNVVTGEPRRSEFEGLFDGDHVKPDGVPMISWFAKYAADSDIAIYGRAPEDWEPYIEKQFPKASDEYRAYCMGWWSFDRYARDHPGPIPVPSQTPAATSSSTPQAWSPRSAMTDRSLI